MRLQHSFQSGSDLASASAGALIEEVINRLGANVQIIVSPEAAEKAGIGGPSKPTAKCRV